MAKISDQTILRLNERLENARRRVRELSLHRMTEKMVIPIIDDVFDDVLPIIEEELTMGGKKTVKGWPADYLDKFWDVCPRKVGKAYMAKILGMIRQRGEVSFDVLMTGMRRYAFENRENDIQYILHPATWLNQGRWDDAPGQYVKTVNGHAPRPGSRDDRGERTHDAIRKLRQYIDADADDAQAGRDAGGSDAGVPRLGKPA